MRNKLVRFSDIGVEPRLVKALRREGIVEPFEVQRESIPDSLWAEMCAAGRRQDLERRLLLGCLCYQGVPMLSRRSRHHWSSPHQRIGRTNQGRFRPTRKVIGAQDNVDLWRNTIQGPNKQAREGRRGCCGVPGRLLDLVEKRALYLENVDIVVLDEADRMADMGFMEPVCEILDACSRSRQTILFSATLDDEVAELVESYQRDPVVIEIGPEEVSMDSMDHIFWRVNSSNKLALSEYVTQNCSPSIVFCKTRAGSNKLGKQLAEMGASVAVLHGGMNQKQRDRSMRKFSTQKVRTLIATDVASRGIDIQGVNCVLHYDPPENGKAYKHRSGRTARAGMTGIVVSLVQKSQQRYYKRIQKQVGISCEITEPVPELITSVNGINPERNNRAKNRKKKMFHDKDRSQGSSKVNSSSSRKSGNKRGRRQRKNFKKSKSNSHKRK